MTVLASLDVIVRWGKGWVGLTGWGWVFVASLLLSIQEIGSWRSK